MNFFDEKAKLNSDIIRSNGGLTFTRRNFYWRMLPLLYLVLGGLITNIFTLPELVRTLASLPCLIAFPVLVGREIHLVLGSKFYVESWDFPSKITLFWLLGFVGSFIIAISFGNNFDIRLYIVGVLTLILGGYWKERNTHTPSTKNKSNNKMSDQLMGLALMAIASLVPIFIYLSFFPPPLTRTLMAFTYIHDTQRIAFDNYLYGLWYTASHPPAYFLLFAVPIWIFDADAFLIWQLCGLLLFPVLGVGTYLYILEVTSGKIFAAITGAFASLWLFNSYIFHYLPVNGTGHSVLTTIFPFVLYLLHRGLRNTVWPSFDVSYGLLGGLMAASIGVELPLLYTFVVVRNNSQLVISILQVYFITFAILLIVGNKILLNRTSGLFLVGISIGMSYPLLHGFVGIFYAYGALLYAIMFVLSKENYNKLRPLPIVILFATLILIIIQYIDLIPMSTSGLSSFVFGDRFEETFYNFDLTRKWMGLIESNSLVMGILILISYGYVLTRKDKRLVPSLILSSSILLAYFFPEHTFYRTIYLIQPTVALFVGLFLFQLIIFVEQSLPHCDHLRKFSVLLVGLFLFMYAVVPYITYWKNRDVPNFTSYEYELGQWLRDNTTRNTRVVSDFFSMRMYNGLTNKVPVAGWSMLWEELSSEQKEQMSWLQMSVFSQKNTGIDKCRAIATLKDYEISNQQDFVKRSLGSEEKHFVIVITDRTIKWMEADSSRPINYSPQQKITPEQIRTFFDPEYFELLYHIPNQGYVFQANIENCQSNNTKFSGNSLIF